jgi:hypothetical protein
VTARNSRAAQLTFDDLPAAEPQPQEKPSRETLAFEAAAAILTEMRADLGYKSWRDERK